VAGVLPGGSQYAALNMFVVEANRGIAGRRSGISHLVRLISLNTMLLIPTPAIPSIAACRNESENRAMRANDSQDQCRLQGDVERSSSKVVAWVVMFRYACLAYDTVPGARRSGNGPWNTAVDDCSMHAKTTRDRGIEFSCTRHRAGTLSMRAQGAGWLLGLWVVGGCKIRPRTLRS
jgi:hypothetical protein